MIIIRQLKKTREKKTHERIKRIAEWSFDLLVKTVHLTLWLMHRLTFCITFIDLHECNNQFVAYEHLRVRLQRENHRCACEYLKEYYNLFSQPASKSLIQSLNIDEIFDASRFPSGRVVIFCFQTCTGLCVQMMEKILFSWNISSLVRFRSSCGWAHFSIFIWNSRKDIQTQQKHWNIFEGRSNI